MVADLWVGADEADDGDELAGVEQQAERGEALDYVCACVCVCVCVCVVCVTTYYY